MIDALLLPFPTHDGIVDTNSERSKIHFPEAVFIISCLFIVFFFSEPVDIYAPPSEGELVVPKANPV
jgi:hypothetical protein